MSGPARSLSVCPAQPPRDALAAARVRIAGREVAFAVLPGPEPEFDPQRAEDRERVLVKVRAFSLNFRDKAIILGAATQGTSPFAIGSELAGEVLAVGADVAGLAPGDRVIANASYPDSGVPGLAPGLPTNSASCERLVVHAARLFPIPATLPDPVAAAFGIGAQTCWSMARRLKLREGQSVLVTAARSNTSLFAIQALRLQPVRIFALTTSDSDHDRLRELGAERVLRVPAEIADLSESAEVVAAARGVGGFNAVVDPFADLWLGRVVNVMAFFGRYVTCGVYDQYTRFVGEEFRHRGQSGQELLVTIFMKNLSVIGNCLGHREDLRRALADYQAGRVPVVLDSVHAGDAIGPFLERTYNAPDRFGKVVFAWD
jgi:NADPH:quinone reductase-like Zn-dependent oxidoreductase